MLVHHRYTPAEAGAALGLTADEVNASAKRLGITDVEALIPTAAVAVGLALRRTGDR